jgi:hypothetical protein
MPKEQEHTMSAYTLPQAYKHMIATPDIWRKLRMGKQTVMNRRVMAGKNEYPSDATMRRWLKKAGWKQAVVEKWQR